MRLRHFPAGFAALDRQSEIATRAADRPTGEAVRSMQLLEGSIVYLFRSIRTLRTNPRAARALSARGEALSNQAEAAGRRAVSFFRQAGLNPRPIK